MKFVFGISLGIIVFLAVFSGIHFYVGFKGLKFIQSFLPDISIKLYWFSIFLLGISFIAGTLLNRRLPSFASNCLTKIGAYWIIILLYLFLSLLLIDIILLLNRLIRFMPESVLINPSSIQILGVIIVFCITISMIKGSWNAANPKVIRYDITINKKLSSGKQSMTIAMVSDIHLGKAIGKNSLQKMENMINDINPDLVLVPGDIVDGDSLITLYEDELKVFSRLKTKYGVYGSLGNHEHFGNDPNVLVEVYDKSGLNILRDSYVKIDNSFYIVGRDNDSFGRGRKRKPLSEILIGVDKSKPIILLDHEPSKLQEPELCGIDFQVSGHTHKGQFFPIDLITKAIFQIDYGYLKKRDFNIVVSSGFGFWGPPVRIGSRSEIVEILLHSQ